MAKKQSYIDPATQGLQTYTQLQQQNAAQFAEEHPQKVLSSKDFAKRYMAVPEGYGTMVNNAMGSQWEDYTQFSPEYEASGGTDSLGTSMFENDIYTDEQL